MKGEKGEWVKIKKSKLARVDVSFLEGLKIKYPELQSIPKQTEKLARDMFENGTKTKKK